MRVGYVLSMFPCWSDTFVLNELVSHRAAGMDLSVFSVRTFYEKIVHDDAQQFVPQTVYRWPVWSFRFWLSSLSLFASSPRVYLSTLWTLLSLRFTSLGVAAKALFVLAMSPRFVAAAKERNLEWLHAHCATYPALLAWIVSRFTGLPFTITVHAHDLYVNQDLLPLLLPAADKVVAISEFNKKFIVDHLGPELESKVVVIHCGINAKRFRARDHHVRGDPPRILSVGRLSGIKGFHHLIPALKLLRDEGIDFQCDIIGDGPLRSRLEQMIEESSLGDRVHLLGAKKTDEVSMALRKADLFVLACARDRIEGHDGIPVVFMEAMAAGVPVIGTQISGVPELIRHSETGLCAESEDPVSLKESIKYALSNPHELEALAAKAKELVAAEFDSEGNSSKLREYFGRRRRDGQ